MSDDNEEDEHEWNWPVIWIIVAIIATGFFYELIDTISFNRALEACAATGGDIHVTWNGRHYCDHTQRQP